MTHHPYTEAVDDGIDVTPLVGRQLSADDRGLFARYQTAFDLAVYYPCVEHFRDCVRAFDAMVRGGEDGTYPHS